MRKGFWPRFWFPFVVFAFKVGFGGSFVRSRDAVSTPPWPNLGSGASVFHFLIYHMKYDSWLGFISFLCSRAVSTKVFGVLK